MKFLIPLIALLGPVSAEALRTASITHVVNDVQVYPGAGSPRLAKIGEKVATPASVQTGRRSRTELTFNDNTITRLGQNSVFSFREGGRNVELKQGSILLQVPKNVGGATIRTATVTAAITGTTVMFEYGPGNWIKLITLEGTQKLSLKGSKNFVEVPAGKMIIMHPDAKVIPAPVTIDLKKLIATSPLAGDSVFKPLPPLARDLINENVKEQLNAKRDGALLPTNWVIKGPGNRTANRLLDSSRNNRLLKREYNVPPKDTDDGTGGYPDGYPGGNTGGSANTDGSVSSSSGVTSTFATVDIAGAIQWLNSGGGSINSYQGTTTVTDGVIQVAPRPLPGRSSP